MLTWPEARAALISGILRTYATLGTRYFLCARCGWPVPEQRWAGKDMCGVCDGGVDHG